MGGRGKKNHPRNGKGREKKNNPKSGKGRGNKKTPKSEKGRGNKSNTKSEKRRGKKNNTNIGKKRGNNSNTKSGKGRGKKNNHNIGKERKKKKNQKQNKKVKPQRKSGKKQPTGDGRLACSRAVNSTCLDTAVKLLKIVTSRITNFLVQQKRMTKYNTTGGKKSGKKGLFGPIASKVIDVGGGNASDLSCSGNK